MPAPCARTQSADFGEPHCHRCGVHAQHEARKLPAPHAARRPRIPPIPALSVGSLLPIVTGCCTRLSTRRGAAAIDSEGGAPPPPPPRAPPTRPPREAQSAPAGPKIRPAADERIVCRATQGRAEARPHLGRGRGDGGPGDDPAPPQRRRGGAVPAGGLSRRPPARLCASRLRGRLIGTRIGDSDRGLF